MLRVKSLPWIKTILKGKELHGALLKGRYWGLLSPTVKQHRSLFTSSSSLLSSGKSCSAQRELPKRRASECVGDPEEETRRDVKGLKVRPVEVKAARVPLSRHAALFEKALAVGISKEDFYEVVDTFVAKDRTRRGHMEFLKTATEYMDQFKLEKDLTAYNKLLDVFPRGRFVNKTLFDAIWAKQYPQSELALDILTKMEENVIKPSIDTYDILLDIFGHASQPVQKCRRLAYWFTKLEEMFPHPLPQQLPENEIDLSRLAFDRMTKEQMDIVVYQVVNNEPHCRLCCPSLYQYNEEEEQEFIVGAQSASQKDLLSKYNTDRPLYVEGPYFMWLRRVQKYFFTLRTDVGFTQKGINTEGAVLAVCMTDCQDREEALRTWITQLQKENPKLAQVNVVFNLQPTLQSVSTSLEKH